jgi:hypothetical protein
MPKRSNLFQDVVAIVHRHMAGDATVEESALLTNRETGAKREVDVVIRTHVAGHDVVVSVEASATSRPADIEWVEQMLRKHSKLPTNTLVLVSAGGFTAAARREAEAGGAAAIAPEDLTANDPQRAVLNRLPKVWPKVVSLTPNAVKIHITRPTQGGDEQAWFRAMQDHLIYFENGEVIGTALEVLQAFIHENFETLAKQIGLADVTETMTSEFVLQIGPPWTMRDDHAVERHLAVRYEDGDAGPEFHRIDAATVTGTAALEANEPIELEHRKLGDVAYAYGEGKVGNVPALIVATEGEERATVTLRTRDSEA